jgi:hypothetical protein
VQHYSPVSICVSTAPARHPKVSAMVAALKATTITVSVIENVIDNNGIALRIHPGRSYKM